MPVFRLPDRPFFPPLEWADADGLLGVGGALSPAWLLEAYASGVFPWYSIGQPLLWWSPDPRLVLRPEWFHISRSLRKILRQQKFTITFDCDFLQVVRACAELRQEQGTWITADMEQAYGQLHTMGYAHSVEAWVLQEEQPLLVGGLYGLTLGKCFFGESMFYRHDNASKAAFAVLMQRLTHEGYELIDCQMTTAHLLTFGAREISRQQFAEQLRNSLARTPAAPQRWR